jgi:hypothetical protein
MRRLIGFLLSGCWHQWETMTRVRIDWRGDYVADDFYQRCTHCGDLRKRRL